jgi:toxin CcdB
MAQFDVHVAPGRNRGAVPYVVVVQSGRFDKLATRLVIPLIAVSTQPSLEGLILTPEFNIESKRVYLNPLEMQTIPRSVLGKHVASLADDAKSSRVITAIDEAISRDHG